MQINLDFHLPEGASLDARDLLPARLFSLSRAQLDDLPVPVGNASLPLGDFTSIDLRPDEPDGLVFSGDTSRIRHIAARMDAGLVRVSGDAGVLAGAQMSGGELRIEGCAGDGLGASLQGGLIRVNGDAGDGAGAAWLGQASGMQGGVILVRGSLGREAGRRMRRGLIAAGQDAGPLAGWEMRAGTILVLGSLGDSAGLGMRRGSLVAGSCPCLLPGFLLTCDNDWTWLRLYGRKLAAWGFPLPPAWTTGPFRRYAGHLTGIGKGEILIYAAAE